MDFLGEGILIDTSAILALIDSRDQNHSSASDFFYHNSDKIQWVILNATKHESYTRARYSLSYQRAINMYNFLSKDFIHQVSFKKVDEFKALNLLKKYKHEKLSFHDALCASIMLRLGLYRVFAYDIDFTYFGFDVLPDYSLLT